MAGEFGCNAFFARGEIALKYEPSIGEALEKERVLRLRASVMWEQRDTCALRKSKVDNSPAEIT